MPGDPHILLIHSPVHVWDILVDQLAYAKFVWDILVDQLAYAKFHLLSIFFRNILHGYSNEQTLTTCMYTFYLTLWCGPPLFLDLQSNLAITQRYPLWNQAVSELWHKREGCNTTEQNIYPIQFLPHDEHTDMHLEGTPPG